MENLLFLGVPILKHIRVSLIVPYSSVVRQQRAFPSKQYRKSRSVLYVGALKGMAEFHKHDLKFDNWGYCTIGKPRLETE